MSSTAMNIARMVDMLPESDQLFAQEFIRKLVLAWDPDFTKATPEEMKSMEEEDMNSRKVSGIESRTYCRQNIQKKGNADARQNVITAVR